MAVFGRPVSSGTKGDPQAARIIGAKSSSARTHAPAVAPRAGSGAARASSNAPPAPVSWSVPAAPSRGVRGEMVSSVRGTAAMSAAAGAGSGPLRGGSGPAPTRPHTTGHGFGPPRLAKPVVSSPEKLRRQRSRSDSSSSSSRRASADARGGGASGAGSGTGAGSGAGSRVDTAATTTSLPYDCAFCLEQNKRPYQEDRVVVEHDVLGSSTLASEVVAVFEANDVHRVAVFAAVDGHAGAQAADYLHKHLVQRLESALAASMGVLSEDRKDPARTDVDALLFAALHTCMVAMDDEFCATAREQRWRAGACINVCVVAEKALYVCNVGDCRAVMVQGGRPRQLSQDHKPNRPDEMERVAAAGGSVAYSNGEHRVLPCKIAVSRSIGDPRAKAPTRYLIPDPEVTVHDIEPSCRFLIVATDGIWGRLSNKDAMNTVRKATSPQAAAESLVQAAIAKGSFDNIGIVVVSFL